MIFKEILVKNSFYRFFSVNPTWLITPAVQVQVNSQQGSTVGSYQIHSDIKLFVQPQEMITS